MNRDHKLKKITVEIERLRQGSYRPSEISTLENKIKNEKKSYALRKSISGGDDNNHLKRINKMELELRLLYIEWAEGKIK